MTKSTRAVWLAEENALQALRTQAQDRGDKEGMTKIYRQIVAHHNTQTLGDLLGSAVDRFNR